jgi:2-polyprenyl-3-methyl-5-hydroxy-6-metoxy-1,4-benzoquinol methylase
MNTHSARATNSYCAICGSSNIKIHRRIHSNLDVIPEGLDRENSVDVTVFKCANCGLLSSPGNETTLQAYQDESVCLDAAISKITADKNVPSVYTFDELSWIGEPDGENLLEVGCSAGYFLLRAREKGWKTFGIDIDRNAVTYAKEKYGLNVSWGSLPESGYQENYFKAIVMIGVLEHILDPVAYLSMARRFLKEDGFMLIAVPNASSLNAKISGLSRHDWDMFCEPGHLYHYNLKTLSLLAERCGFVASNWRTTTIKIRGKIPFLPTRLPRLERTLKDFYSRSVVFRTMYETSLKLLDMVNLGDILVVKMVKK